MQLVQGNLWKDPADLILFPANSNVGPFGRAIMGAGCAAEAKRRVPDLPDTLGAWLVERHLAERDFLLWLPDAAYDPDAPVPHVGALQSKRRFWEPADLDLVARSCRALAQTLPMLPWIRRVAMAMPGTGLGKLRREDVLPLLEVLPAGVYIYEYPRASP